MLYISKVIFLLKISKFYFQNLWRHTLVKKQLQVHEIKSIFHHFKRAFIKVNAEEAFSKKGVLRNFTKFTGKHLRQSLSSKKRLWHRCFPVNFAKFIRTCFSLNTSWRLLLQINIFWGKWEFDCNISRFFTCKNFI